MRCVGLEGEDSALVRAVLLDLVGLFARRGVAVATLFEAPSGFDPDTPGKDSHEHRKAGALEVRLVSDHLEALAHENRPGEATDPLHLARRLAPAELVLIEGFAAHPHPKVRVTPEADRQALADRVWAKAQEVAG
jgi:molybdopterin-guanine dinucleotide biosynthesis protein B